MSEINPDMKPCPFCGHQGMTWHIDREVPWVVECTCCFARGPRATTEREAILAWNAGAKE